MNAFFQDFRHGARIFVKSPGFSAVIVLTLVLGIGANTAIFSIVNAVLLRPLPYQQAEQIIRLWTHFAEVPRVGASEPEYLDYRAGKKSIEHITAFVGPSEVSLLGGEEPERISALFATWELFPTLRVQAVRGRVFQEEDDRSGAPPVAVISHGLWQRRFGSDPGIVGRTIDIGGQQKTVIGIMPVGFDFPQGVDLWMPLAIDPANLAPRGQHYLEMIARLRPGVSVAQAQAEVDGWVRQIQREYQYRDATWGVTAISLLDDEVGAVRPALLILLGAVSFVLLIACANVVNVLLVRIQSREREISVRTVLGAGRTRLLRQFLTESLLLAVIGGALGVLVAYWGVNLFVAHHPDSIPRTEAVPIDGRVLGFTLALVLVTSFAVGLVPAWKASRPNLNEFLKEGGKSTTGAGGQAIRRFLVILEVALALVLLTGAGLLVRSFIQLSQVEPGFQPEGLLTLQLSPPRSKYSDGPSISSLYSQIMQRVGALPAVTGTALVTNLPFSPSNRSSSVSIEGQFVPPGEALPESNLNTVSSDYFGTMGIALRSGRTFRESDDRSAPLVVVINEEMAKSLPPGRDPIGRRLKLGPVESEDPWMTIVGVVSSVKQSGLSEAARKEIYFPHAQRTERTAYLVVRTSGPDAMDLLPAVRREIRQLDRDLPISSAMSMEERIGQSLSQPRFSTLLLGIFAAIAVALAAVGIYGVISYSVAQRTREIGIRIALGAQRRKILQQVVGSDMLVVLVGVATGLAAAFSLTRLLASLLYGIQPADLETFVAVCLLLSAVALLAMLLPARRAVSLEPTTALRHE